MLSRLRKSRDGAAAIEFAILAMPYFLIIFAIIETFVAFMGEQLVVNATDTMARKVRTGQITSGLGLTSNMSKEQFKQAFCDEVSILITCSPQEVYKSQKLYIDLRTFSTFKDIPANLALKKVGEYYDLDESQMGYTPGGPGTINMLRVYYRWQVFTDLIRPYITKVRPVDGSMPSHFLIVGTGAFQNEPYPTGSGS